MTDYVWLIFRPAGGKRKRTMWAIPGVVRNGVASFWRVQPNGNRPDQQELILAYENEVETRPAVMNLHYAELELGIAPGGLSAPSLTSAAIITTDAPRLA
jgi:hypothetical protein